MDEKQAIFLSTKIKAGSEKHFKIFFDLTHIKVYGVCLNMGLNKEDAEEILQEAYVQLWNQRDKINTELSLYALLKTIAKRLIYKKWRKPNHTIISLEKREMEEIVEDKPLYFDREYLEKVLHQLPKIQKKTIELFYFEGNTIKEITMLLNSSPRTVENNLFRAKKKLSNMLKEEDVEDVFNKRLDI